MYNVICSFLLNFSLEILAQTDHNDNKFVFCLEKNYKFTQFFDGFNMFLITNKLRELLAF